MRCDLVDPTTNLGGRGRSVGRWTALVLLIAVALAQQLGFMHRFAHFELGERYRHAPAALSEPRDAREGQASAWIKALFPAHDEDGCALFDGATASGAPSAAATQAHPRLSSTKLAPIELAQCAGTFAAFDARAPPPSILGS